MLIKYSGKYVKIYFNAKITFLVLSIHLYPVVCCVECLWWPEWAFTLYAYNGMSVI